MIAYSDDFRADQGGETGGNMFTECCNVKDDDDDSDDDDEDHDDEEDDDEEEDDAEDENEEDEDDDEDDEEDCEFWDGLVFPDRSCDFLGIAFGEHIDGA